MFNVSKTRDLRPMSNLGEGRATHIGVLVRPRDPAGPGLEGGRTVPVAESGARACWRSYPRRRPVVVCGVRLVDRRAPGQIVQWSKALPTDWRARSTLRRFRSELPSASLTGIFEVFFR